MRKVKPRKLNHLPKVPQLVNHKPGIWPQGPLTSKTDFLTHALCTSLLVVLSPSLLPGLYISVLIPSLSLDYQFLECKITSYSCSPMQHAINRKQGRKDGWGSERCSGTTGLWLQLSKSSSRPNYEVGALYSHQKCLNCPPNNFHSCTNKPWYWMTWARIDQLPARFWVAARVSSKKWCLFQLISLGGQLMQAAGNSRLPAWTDGWSSGVTFRRQVEENAGPERNLDRVSNLLAMEFWGDKSSHLSWHSWKRHPPPPISTPNWDGLEEYSLRAKAFIQKEDSWAGGKLTQVASVWVFKDQSEFGWWVHWKFLVSWPDPLALASAVIPMLWVLAAHISRELPWELRLQCHLWNEPPRPRWPPAANGWLIWGCSLKVGPCRLQSSPGWGLTTEPTSLPSSLSCPFLPPSCLVSIKNSLSKNHLHENPHLSPCR